MFCKCNMQFLLFSPIWQNIFSKAIHTKHKTEMLMILSGNTEIYAHNILVFIVLLFLLYCILLYSIVSIILRSVFIKTKI